MSSTHSVKDSLAAHAALSKAARNGDTVDKETVATVVAAITEHTADVVTRDAILAHTLLLAVFHRQFRDDANEAKDLCLSLMRFAEDTQRCYGHNIARISFPLMRLAKVASGSADTADFGALRAFWAAHMPADEPYELHPVSIDESTATGKIAACPSCKAEQTSTMPVDAAFRLHKKAAMCTSCATAFTVEHVAVHRFLTLAPRMPAISLAGTLTHPKTRLITPMHRDNKPTLRLSLTRPNSRSARLPCPRSPPAGKRDALFLHGNGHRFN
ncbi:hypothetical protein AMAG_09955 [Allomyces macrogynus ATCC 38327]|uniref:Uncharacterized protein n=1 Tax=Allomyces macrogynus (strain ATCC 38327) TaxID=578462 RepID=A0A0L0SQE9_ALLM3|nr:hypothetical protein AMAG_09955 [Allomyces macrogynus ATCC 38327]|eukprot:KNE64599.1 hypothetical protein AMAG_09955 [Allomyces macrogynus ATCC 38327]